MGVAGNCFRSRSVGGVRVVTAANGERVVPVALIAAAAEVDEPGPSGPPPADG